MAKVICKICGAEMDLPNHEAMCIGAFNDKTDNIVGVLPTKLPKEKENKTMAMISKVDALKAAGFSDEQINKMIGIVGFNKDEVIQSDEITEQILNNRGAMNDVSFRPRITAQFVKAHFLYNGNVQEYINGLDANYQFSMMTEECRQLMKMERDSNEELNIRSCFFTLQRVKGIFNYYLSAVESVMYGLTTKDKIKHCKGIPYVHYNGLNKDKYDKHNVFQSDILQKVISPVRSAAWKVDRAKNYTEMYKALNDFFSSKDFVRLPYNYKKNKEWIDAFKGNGAYYSLMNLSQFSGLIIKNYKTGKVLNKYEARCYLEQLAHTVKGYELYGCFKDSMFDNNFTYDTFVDICKRTKAERLLKQSK